MALTIREANEPNRVAALVNAMASLNEYISEKEFGVYDSKSTF